MPRRFHGHHLRTFLRLPGQPCGLGHFVVIDPGEVFKEFARSVQHIDPMGEICPGPHFGGRQRACSKSAFSTREVATATYHVRGVVSITRAEVEPHRAEWRKVVETLAACGGTESKLGFG
jgi:hypothetical protein